MREETVVIKGDALCYYLYFKNHRWQNGGHYYEFYSTVRAFFNRLQEQSTYAFVVMNGADTDQETYKKRCVERLNRISSILTPTSSVRCSVLPLFAKAVFVDALRDCGIPFVFSDGDGDPDCVALANHLVCYVLAR